MPELPIDRFTRVEFTRFKAFERFRVDLKRFNVLVGPNNAGKSTIIAAFRILSEGLRRANSRKAEIVQGPISKVFGHPVNLKSAFVAEENLFFDYRSDEPAFIEFFLESGNKLTLFFPEQETCYLIPDAQGKICKTPASFKNNFRCRIGFAPILSPVDHQEKLFERDAARLALLNYRASRNFRNIWWHFSEKFDQFRGLVESTWPGMSVERPEAVSRDGDTYLYMFCPENRKPREIFWSGFGFQVWCQMLTHIVQSDEASIFLIDEPDVYLHSDLQRQLVAILKELGPDICIATHSTEIISECDADEIVVIDKRRSRARRLRTAVELGPLFGQLGSLANPILTQLAKTRRVVFVEGGDFRLLSKFAQRCGLKRVSARSDFAVVPIEGFNPERVRSLKAGMEHPLGRTILSGVILDRDYRSAAECEKISNDLKEICFLSVIHRCKEIENFLLVPEVLNRIARSKIIERKRRDPRVPEYCDEALKILLQFGEERKIYLTSQFTRRHMQFQRQIGSTKLDETLMQEGLAEFERRWSDLSERLRMIPGKEALSHLNGYLQTTYKVSLTPVAIIDGMRREEVPDEVVSLLGMIERLAATAAPG